MRTEDKKLKAHLFICTHQRDDRASCAGAGSAQLVSELKDWVKSENLKESIKVTRSGCLGRCEEGIAAVCYPAGQWFTELTAQDQDVLKNKCLK